MNDRRHDDSARQEPPCAIDLGPKPTMSKETSRGTMLTAETRRRLPCGALINSTSEPVSALFRSHRGD